jgi:hypothetical protein
MAEPISPAKLRRRVGWVISAALSGLGGLAITRELRTARLRRRWHGRVAGIPYDFRRPTLTRLRDNVWSPRRRQIIVPRTWGVGWELNVGRLWHLARRP